MNKRCVTMIITLMVLALLACESTPLPGPGSLSMYPTLTSLPSPGYNQETAYAAAQSTLASGQSEILGLSHQATVVSLNMEQAANIAAQATLNDNQRQLMELSIQATTVSRDMARAAATQQFIMEQTQMAQNATATTQSQAATATYAAYILNVTQTAQAQAILDAHASETVQANATRTAYALTATPEAIIQADIVQTRSERERRGLWEAFVVTPLKLALLTLVVLLLITGMVMAYRQLMPVLEFRLRNPRGNDIISPAFPVDEMIVDLDPYQHPLTQQELRQLNQPQFPNDETPQVEIIDPSEPAIVNWITEAEHKLRADRRIYP
ncbi:MAG: hypothetical protein JXA33_04965 [Anaerolineae bacterium]|nr:hypothetical protein [Anaerolineae bacterium]